MKVQYLGFNDIFEHYTFLVAGENPEISQFLNYLDNVGIKFCSPWRNDFKEGKAPESLDSVRIGVSEEHLAHMRLLAA
jgi:hypothetical protein